MIFLVRHGAVHNPKKLRYGRLPGFPLSDEGREQARAAGAALAARSLRRPRVISSPLERADETARLIAAALGPTTPVETDARLIEIGSRFDGLPRRFAPGAYLARSLASRDPDEPISTVASRMLTVIDDASRHDDDVILVSHQVPIQVAIVASKHGASALRGALPEGWRLRRLGAPDVGYAQALRVR